MNKQAQSRLRNRLQKEASQLNRQSTQHKELFHAVQAAHRGLTEAQTALNTIESTLFASISENAKAWSRIDALATRAGLRKTRQKNGRARKG